MCGIFYLSEKNEQHCDSLVDYSINTIKSRGPDVSTIISRKNGEVMGFHRLMINGANGLSNQPMTIDGETYLLCNGEIYNHVELQKKYDIKCTNGSDCEIILHLYNKIGFEKTVQELDGEFAIILITPDKVYIARDPYGVRALYFALNNKLNLIGIASENKALYHLFQHKNISQFPPGCIAEWNKQDRTYKIPEPYYNYTHQLYKELRPGGELEEECILKVRKLLINAVNKRIMCSRIDKTTNRLAIGAYLSGGFDSSAIAAILQKELPYRLETFSIGFKGSPDLHYARIVADYIGSNHTQVIITETQALNAIPDVIEAIESYDITTVRASTMMYLLSKHISEHTNIAVMFSGEGSDEASGSYRYFDNAPSDDEFHIESERLLKDLCYFDNLRADKSSAAWGLELRVPFLDLEFLDYYMTIPRCIKTQQGLEKYLLRKAVGNYLPDEVLYRPKEAMSDGVSGHNRSWSTIIQDEAKRHYNMEDGLAAEKKLYKSFFDQNYKGCDHQIPYYWLPKWCGDIQDPSARVLSIYKK